MKEKIFNNLSLKILSVVCAVLLWTIIVNIYDPNTGVTVVNIPVEMINSDSLKQEGYNYEVIDGSKISVYVSGPKSQVANIKATDIVATADLSKVTEFTDYVDIEVKVIKDGQQLNGVEVTPKTSAVKLDIEKNITQLFDINIQTTGNPTDGYVITKQTVTPSNVSITGSSKTISKIASVVAVSDISGCQADLTVPASIEIHDLEGNIIDDGGLTYSFTETEYHAVVQASKTVPIVYSVEGTPAANYSISKTEVSQDSIVISGEKKKLDEIREIVIPAINIEGIDSDKTYRKWISEYLPSDISVVSENLVTINVKVLENKTREFNIPTTSITISGIDKSKYNVIFTSPDILNITVNGSGENFDHLTSEDLKLLLNLSGLAEGTYNKDINIELPDGCNIAENYTVNFTITAQNTITAPETSSTEVNMEQKTTKVESSAVSQEIKSQTP